MFLTFVADETGKRSGRHSLQRVGAPVTEGNYTGTKWKVLKMEGQDAREGHIQEISGDQAEIEKTPHSLIL